MNNLPSFINRRTVAVSLIVLLIISFAPSGLIFSPLRGNELDGSWQYAISRTKHLSPPMIFGKDIAFTFGPLGFLLAGPVLPDEKFSPTHAFSYSMNLLLILAMLFIFINMAIKAGNPIFWLLTMLALPYPLLFFRSATAWSGLATLLAMAAVSEGSSNTARKTCLALLAFLGPFALMVRYPLGLLFFLMLGLALLANLHDQDGRGFLLGLAAFSTAGIVILWKIFSGGGIASLITYLVIGAQISSRYCEYMMSNKALLVAGALWFYAVPLMIIVTNTILGRKLGNNWIAAILAVSSFMLFKEGFVRADAHILTFFPGQWYILLGITSLLHLPAKRSFFSALLVSLVVMWLICYQAVLSEGKIKTMFIPRDDIIQNIKELPASLNPSSSFNSAAAMSSDKFNGLKQQYYGLFKKLDACCTPNKTITFLPWELLFAELVKAKWRPLPTLQLYHSEQVPSYMDLDRELFSGSSPVDIIVLGTKSLDGRSSVAELSHILKEVVEGYRVSDKSDGYFILKRRNRNAPLVFTPYVQGKACNDPLLFIKALNVKKHPWFDVQNIMFKGPQFSIEISRGNKKDKWRAYASQLEEGAFYNIPGTDLEQVLSGERTGKYDKISVRLVPEIFAGICLNSSPEFLIMTCHIAQTEN